jgi:hypothetical protein
MANSIYSNIPLAANSEDCRLLHLLPASFETEIQVEMRVMNLEDWKVEQYGCLSYVWGDMSVTKSILVNNHQVQVTTNLHDALQHVRKRDELVKIWVDAICINQSDVMEKNYQVYLMEKIYKRCALVYIWLGRQEVNGAVKGDPFRYLQHFQSNKHCYELPGFRRSQSNGTFIFERNVEMTSLLNDFLTIARCPWWTRAWTVQESILPQKTRFMYSHWHTTWEIFADYNDLKIRHGYTCCFDAFEELTQAQSLEITEINKWAFQIEYGHGARLRLGGPKEVSSPDWFLRIIHTFSSRQSKDPRDKIYSLLALASPAYFSDFRPDYKREVWDVYLEVFCRMLEEASWDWSCFMGDGFGSAILGLPSWVRDFSTVVPVDVVGSQQRRMWFKNIYHASLEPLGNMKIVKGIELHHRGYWADRIKFVGPAEGTLPASQLLNQWIELCRKASGVVNKEVLRKTFCRIICGDVVKERSWHTFNRARQADLPDKLHFKQLMNGDLTIDGQGFGWGITFSMKGRSFFVTESRKMGLCSPNTLPGDEVWVLNGFLWPFVFRSQLSSEMIFSMVGDCFLQGIMDGEASGQGESRQIVII